MAAGGPRPAALWQRPAGVIPLGKKEKVDDSLGLSAWGPAHTATGLAAFGTECRPCYSWAERNGLTSVLAGGTQGAGAEPPFPVRVDGSDAMLKLPGLGLDCALFLLCSVPSSFLQNVGGVPEQHMPGKRRDVWQGVQLLGHGLACLHYASPSQAASHGTRNLGTSQPEQGALKTIGFPPCCQTNNSSKTVNRAVGCSSIMLVSFQDHTRLR